MLTFGEQGYGIAPTMGSYGVFLSLLPWHENPLSWRGDGRVSRFSGMKSDISRRPILLNGNPLRHFVAVI
jgi:hypothetical protein